jgi:hypothetical protein
MHKRHIYTWKEVKKLARQMEWSVARCTHIEFLLEHQLFEVKKEDIAQLDPEQNYMYFILLCSRWTSGFHRNWNPHLFDRAVSYLWKWYNAIGPLQIKIQDFHTLANASSWSAVAKSYPYNNSEWFKWMWKYFDTEEGKAHLFDKELDDEIDDVAQHLATQENFRKQIGFCKSVGKAKCRVRMNVIRKDLMETTWHPKRVVNWCFDEEDKELIGVFGK